MTYTEIGLVFKDNLPIKAQEKIIDELSPMFESDYYENMNVWHLINDYDDDHYEQKKIIDFLKRHKDKIKDFKLTEGNEVMHIFSRIRKYKENYILETGHIEYKFQDILI